MGKWQRAYPTQKIKDLNAAIAKGMGTKLTDQDIMNVIQSSSSYQDFAKKLIETHSVAAELNDVIALCNQHLG